VIRDAVDHIDSIGEMPLRHREAQARDSTDVEPGCGLRAQDGLRSKGVTRLRLRQRVLDHVEHAT